MLINDLSKFLTSFGTEYLSNSVRRLSAREKVHTAISCGIMDVLRIRKEMPTANDFRRSRGDAFEIILLLMKKPGARRPKHNDIERIRILQRLFAARDVVLYEWEFCKYSRFSRLVNGNWEPASAEEIFGRKSRSR